MTATALPRPIAASLVAGPAVWFLGWTIMRLRTTDGPGAAWTTAHSLWIVSFVLMGVGCVGLARLAGSRTRAGVLALVVALAGAALTTGQMVFDLYVGFTPTEAAMDARSDAVFAIPGVELICYTLAPVVLYVGMLALLVLAAARRTAPVPLVVVAGCGILAAGIGHPMPGALRFIEGAGALLIAVAFAGIVRSRPTTRGAATTAGAPTMLAR